MRTAFLVISFILLIIINTSISAGQWGKPPDGWDDFKFGLIEGNVEPWKTQLEKALDAGIQIDYRYRYCTQPDAVSGWLFTPWYNYANGPNGIRPSLTIYMAAKNSDDINVLLAAGKDKAFMTSYFKAIKTMADSCKGTKPIWIIEPDVWGYFLQFDNGGLGSQYLNQTCNINNVGISCLSQFSNTYADLAAAVIALVKDVDPDCYVGLLMAHWGFNSFWLPNPEENAQKTVPYLKKLLRDPYKGDFLAIEKYGADAGSMSDIWMWDDVKNGDFVTWAKTLAMGIDLPLCGWQTSIGYENGKEPGYPDLPNQPFAFEDTFFPYFFRHVNDFLNAGFIGYLAGNANAGQGTVYGLEKGQYDNGWFLDNLKVFNANRPYNLNISTSIEDESKHYSEKSETIQACVSTSVHKIKLAINSPENQLAVSIFDAKGSIISKVFDQNISSYSAVIEIDKRVFGAGIYFAEIKSGSFKKTIPINLAR